MYSFFMQLSNRFDKAEILVKHLNFVCFCNILDMQVLRKIKLDNEVQTVPSLFHP